MRKFVLCLLPVFSFCLAHGQILNIENFRFDKDTVNAWGGNIGFGFSTKQQQNSVTTLNANSNLAYFAQKHTYLTINYIKFIAVEKSEVISEGYLHLRTILYRKKFVSYEPFLQLQYDLGRGLQRRALCGFSFRFNFLKTKKFIMAANTGIMYEHEAWEGEVLRYPTPEIPQRAETSFIKSTSNFTLRGDIAHNVYLLFVTYYQARYEKFLQPRIITDLQVNLKISKVLSLSNQFTSTYDALPILRNNKFIYSLSTNLLINF